MSERAAPVWMKIAPTRGRATVMLIVFTLAAVRFAASAVAAIHFNEGDFFATLPGPYAEHWNLRLWDSPDLSASVAFHRHSYGYGPTQYLTLWPIVLLDSYRQIAAVLLPIYVGLVLATAYVLWRVCERLVPSNGFPIGRMLSVFASVLLFGPMLVALGQREFEVVQAFMLALAAYCLVSNRPAAGAAILGYISMFKYWVLGLSVYFVLKRQWTAAVAFAVAAAAVLLVAHAVFDLGRFPFASNTAFDRQFGRIYKPLQQNTTFCADETGTAASVGSGLCAIAGGRSRVAQVAFYGLVGVASATWLALFVAIERGGAVANPFDDRWRRLLELCFLLIAAGVVFHAHYYYLSILILPLTLLLYRSLWMPGGAAGVRVTVAAAAYIALSAFVVPPGLLSRITGGDAWSFYLSHGVYLYGYLLLVGLLFWEYGMLLRSGRRQVAHGTFAGASS